jgi:hypothetical protein
MGENRTGGDRHDRQRLTVPEAATVLGVTVDAVRGRVRRGTIDSERDREGTVYVLVDAPDPGPSPTVEGPAGPSSDQATASLVGALQEQVSYLRDQLEAERNAHAETRRIAYTLAQRVPELEAMASEATEATVGSETASEEPGRGDVPPEGQGEHHPVERPSWWRRFFGFE